MFLGHRNLKVLLGQPLFAVAQLLLGLHGAVTLSACWAASESWSTASQVKVRLRNKAEVEGYISKIEDASFDVTDKNTDTRPRFPTLTWRKYKGRGLSKGAKIGIIVGIAVVVVAVVFAVGLSRAGY